LQGGRDPPLTIKLYSPSAESYGGHNVRPHDGAERGEMRTMRTDEIKQVVKTRYGKFAETGGKPEAC
jgi:hypothetical protein